MASVTRQANDRVTIQFKAPDRKRKSIRLGVADEATVNEVKVHVEHLADCWARKAPPSTATNEWVARLSADPANHWLYDRLAAVGLVTARKEAKPKAKSKTQETRLRPFLDAYFAKRTDVKSGTKTTWHYGRKDMVDFFGADKRIDTLTAGDAKDFERHMLANLGADTARRRIGFAKQFFGDAVDRELIARNPFAKLKSAGKGNRSRDFFVTLEMADKIIKACPDAEWRLIFALCRFGGLRCPSEVVALRLDDVDWEKERILIRSPKTEHHEGKESRIIPLFPELRPYLEEVFDAAEPGTEFFVSRSRKSARCNTDRLLTIINRAGLKPWPKLFNNLRATRETELAESFPAHVVCAWIGNSEAIARKHYLQVTDDHFAVASKSGAQKRCNSGQQQGDNKEQQKSVELRNPQETAVLAGVTAIDQMSYHDNG